MLYVKQRYAEKCHAILQESQGPFGGEMVLIEPI